MVGAGDGAGDRSAGEEKDGGDEGDPGGVAAGEGEVIEGNDGVVVVVGGVGRARSASEGFDEADEDEVEEGAEDEREEEVGAERGGRRGGEEEGECDGEEEAEIGEVF